MKLESFKSELFDNKIDNPESIIGGISAGATSRYTICTNPHTGETCESYDGPDTSNW